MSSEATAIRNAIYDRLKDWPGYKTLRKTYVPQIQPEQLPILSIVLMQEKLSPDGDYNAGEPHFISETTIGISLVRGFDDIVVLDDAFSEDLDRIELGLLTDPTFVTANPTTGFFEGISAISRRRLFPNQGETYFSELRLEMTFVTRITYEPIVPDAYKKTVMTVNPLGHPDAPEITVVIDLAQ